MTEVWNSSQAANQGGALGASVKFGVPAVADGQVFVGTASNTLVVYGLTPPPSGAPAAPTNLTATALSSTSIGLPSSITVSEVPRAATATTGGNASAPIRLYGCQTCAASMALI